MSAVFLLCILHCRRMTGSQEDLLAGDFSDTLEDEKWCSPRVLHTHAWVHKLNPDRVPDTFGRIILMGEEHPQRQGSWWGQNRALCWLAVLLLEGSQGAVHTQTHATIFLPRTQAPHQVVCDVLMLLAAFSWRLTTAILSENFSSN